MKYRVKFLNINNKFYDVLPTVKIVEKFSEELDMYEFSLATIEEKIDFDFKKYNGLIPMVLNRYDETLGINRNIVMYLTNYKYTIVEYNPKKYQCVIQATSSNIKLQRIVLPNKLITQHIWVATRTVWQELNKIMEVYAPDIMIDTDLESKMSIPCPEFQFVKATLYEVLVTLFAVCGLIPKMDDEYTSYLTFIELKGTGVNHTFNNHLIRFEESNSITEYADMYDYDIENAISKDADITTHWIAPTSDEGVINWQNFYFKMPTTIYEIKKVELYTADSDIGYAGAPLYMWNKDIIDITDAIVPKTIFDTLLVSSKTMGSGFGDWAKYKRFHGYYEQDKIDFSYLESSWFPSVDVGSVQGIIARAFIDDGGIGDPYVVTLPENVKLLIKVTYQSEADNSRVKIIRKGITNPQNALISNQEESYIDIINFGNQKQETINRMGNTKILGQANYELTTYDLNNIPQLGDTFENDYIIVEKQIQMNENNMLVNYVLSKDYVYETGFSGLKQVKRFTAIDTQNTLIRNDNYLMNYKLTNVNTNTDYKSKFLIENYGKATNSVNLHYVKPFNENDNQVIFDYLLVQTQNKYIADSIICQFQFETNVKAGNAITKEGDYYVNNPVSYTNSLGEFKTLRYYFGQAENERDVSDLDAVSKRPIVELDSEPLLYDDLVIYKDQREITSITKQFRVVGDKDNGIFVYDNFAKYTQLTARDNDIVLEVYVKYFTDETEYNNSKYNENTNTPIGETSSVSTITFEENKIKVSSVGDMNQYCCVGIVANGELVIGVNFLLLSAIPTLELYLNRI